MALNFKLNLFTDAVLKDIQKGEKDLRGKAARHLRKVVARKIKQRKISLPGEPPGRVTGDLLRGLKMSNRKTVALIGFKPPAQHATILEFGGKDIREHKTGKSTGYMDARPVLFPTFAEEAPTVRKIMSGDWLN